MAEFGGDSAETIPKRALSFLRPRAHLATLRRIYNVVELMRDTATTISADFRKLCLHAEGIAGGARSLAGRARTQQV